MTELDKRASDSDRERTATALRLHGGEGRLTVEELEDRLERAYSARTMGELATLTADLPDPPRDPVRKRARARADFRQHASSYLLVNLMLVAIWAATGAGYFWPFWPMLGWGIAVAFHARDVYGGRRRRSG